MLVLLDSPRWRDTASGMDCHLPATLPACLLVVLAMQARWVDRHELCALFWPDSIGSSAASHNLRVNLHRLRELLDQLGIDKNTLQAERTRLMLRLPSDIACLRQAIALRDSQGLQQWPATVLVRRPGLPNFGGFHDWYDEQARDLAQAWRRAVEAALEAAVRIGDLTQAEALLASAAGEDKAAMLARLARLEFAPISLEARTCWRALQTQSDPAVQRARATAQPVPGRRGLQRQLLDSPAVAVALLGEAGMGKTTVLSASYPGAAMLRGREGLQALPYRPVLEWLQGQVAALKAQLARPDDTLGPYRLDLARVLPELAPDEPLPPLDAVTAKARLLEALSRAFETMTPVLLVDDLQWCDAATLDWLASLAHRGRLRWRASARRHEIGDNLHHMLRSLESTGLLCTLALEPLDGEGVGAACRARWPDRIWSATAINRLHAESAGNPFVLCELVAAQTENESSGATRHPRVPARVHQFVARRLDGLSPQARQLVEAAAVLAQPVPALSLFSMADGPDAQALGPAACEQALRRGMLREGLDGQLECAHDLIRSVAYAELSAARRQWLHRQAARLLESAAGMDDPLAVVRHWQLAADEEAAIPWWLRAAQLAKERGQYDMARALWQQVAQAQPHSVHAMWARLGLADCDLTDDLATGRQRYLDILEDIGAVADPPQRRRIEARLLAGLVDNRVFAGDTQGARKPARRLRRLLPGLTPTDRCRALEALIELAMREPDLEGASKHVKQMQRLAPDHPMTASMAAQVHWVSGDVRAAAEGFEQLLTRHPAWCSGLTIENDLAVMLHALGRLRRAEAMARRSLESWKGVPHTQALSRLVLGSVLTSMGRYDEAREVLQQALQLAHDQASRLFESEALMRLARVQALAGQTDDARRCLDRVTPMLADEKQPLKLSQLVLAHAAWSDATGALVDHSLIARLREICSDRPHPIALVRLAKAEVTSAMYLRDAQALESAAERLVQVASKAGLQEWLAEGLLLSAAARADRGQPASAQRPLLLQALSLARAERMGPLQAKAQALLERETPDHLH